MTRLPKNGLAGSAAVVEADVGVEVSEARADKDGVAAAGAGLPVTGPAATIGVKVPEVPPGVKLAAFGLKGLNELALALNLKDEVLTEEGIPPSALAVPFAASTPSVLLPLVPAAAAACRALNLSGLNGGIFGIVIF